VDRYARLIMLMLVLAVTLVRLIRSMKAATAKRPAPAVAPAAGVIVQPPASAATAAPQPAPASTCVSPIEPETTTGGRLAAGLTTVAVWTAGNIAIWTGLFGLAALDGIPPLVRGVAGVLANFYLIHLARAAGARLRNRAPQTLRREGDTPFI
jgi:hypothetical protein